MYVSRHVNALIAFSLIYTIGISRLEAKTLEFSLYDNYGRKVSSQDYKGVPIFLEFGACW